MKNIKHLFVPYALAVNLRKKGFIEPCLSVIWSDNEIAIGSTEYSEIMQRRDDSCIACPLFEQATEWLEREYNFFFERLYNELEKEGFIIWKDQNSINFEQYDNLNQAITEALKLN